MSSIPPFYYLALFCMLLIGANLLFIVLRRIRLQFAFGVAFLLCIIFTLGYMMSLGASYLVINLLNIYPFSLYFALVFTLGTLLVNILGYSKDAHYASFSLLSSFALMGMYLVSFSNSLVTTFIGLELMAIPTVFAILLSKRVAIEASVKLFILSSVAIALFSFALVLVYGITGSTAFVNYATISTIMALALALIIAALGFEAALFPFSLWVPDVYQGAGSHVSAMLGGINKKVGFLALMEILFFLFSSYKLTFMPVLYVIAIVTMFYGNLVGLAQKNVKRLLAYSSIAQAGYILIGIVVATNYSISAVMFQVFSHMLMFIGAMALVLFMESKGRNEINDYIGLHKESSISAFCMAILLLSFIGVPLTAGFFGKFLLFSSAIYANMLPLAIAGIINSVISVYYYFKIIAAMYTSKAGAFRAKIGANILFVIVACTLLVLLMGIYPDIVMGFARLGATFLS